MGALLEERHRRVPSDRCEIVLVLLVGHGQRRYRVLTLGREVERRTTRDEDPHPRCAAEDLADQRRGGENVLEAVEDEEQLLFAQVPSQGDRDLLVAPFRRPERTGDLRGHEPRVPDGSE